MRINPLYIAIILLSAALIFIGTRWVVRGCQNLGLGSVEGMEGMKGMKGKQDKITYKTKPTEIYDKFYAGVYDDLMRFPPKDEYEVDAIDGVIKLGSLPCANAVDLGSGTGHHVKLLAKKGMKCLGIDASKDMVAKAKENYPDMHFKQADITSSMALEPSSVSLITSFSFTIYYLSSPEKRVFFQNCFRWLKPGGYLVIHLVNKDKFNTIIPAADPFIIISPQNYVKQRLTHSVVHFNKHKYTADFKFDEKGGNKVRLEEWFKHRKNGNVRQNEHVLHMERQTDILALSKDVGFKMKSKIDLGACGYENQFLYVLQKP